MLNSKAEIIWSNEDFTTNSIPEMNNDNRKVFIDDSSTGNAGGDARRSTFNNQGERSNDELNGHVFIDRDTDISYYDNENDDNFDKAASSSSSSSFLAVNSSNPSYATTISIISLAHFYTLLILLIN